MKKEGHSSNQINFINVCVAVLCLLYTCQVASTVDFNSRMLGGGDTHRDFPFIVALFEVKKYKFFCGGTIISNRHILTAANCVERKSSGRKLSPADIVVRLGAYNLLEHNEEGARLMNVMDIYIHPDWKVYEESYDADIAILLLSEEIAFTKIIAPVSLPADDEFIDGTTINVAGTIVGWGATDYPRQITIKALNDSYCYRSDYGTVTLSSQRTFCGGEGNGTPTLGDSGGGFFVSSKTDWVQYGVISASRTNQRGHIDMNSISIYGNVRSFKNWINEIVKLPIIQLAGADSAEAKKIDLECRFGFIKFDIEEYGKGYGCFLYDLDVRTNNTEVANFTVHHNKKPNKPVNVIYFQSGTMFSLVNGIGNQFKTLKILQLEPGLGTTLIAPSSLKNLENLQKLNIYKNEIAKLDEDVLYGLPSLLVFKLIDNKLKILSEKIFDKNRALQQVNLNSNELEFLPRNLFRNCHLLQKVNFGHNFLKVIETDFTVMKIWNIIFDGNTCTIDEFNVCASVYGRKKFRKCQAHIDRNCKAPPSYERNLQ